MNWYLLANGLYDEVTDPTHNARLLEKFYQRHQLHAEFNWGHPHIGPLIVKFAAAVAVPAGVENSGGFVKAFEIQMVGRSEERRVGKECVSQCRSWMSPVHLKKKTHKT